MHQELQVNALCTRFILNTQQRMRMLIVWQRWGMEWNVSWFWLFSFVFKVVIAHSLKCHHTTHSIHICIDGRIAEQWSWWNFCSKSLNYGNQFKMPNDRQVFSRGRCIEKTRASSQGLTEATKNSVTLPAECFHWPFIDATVFNENQRLTVCGIRSDQWYDESIRRISRFHEYECILNRK